MSGFFGKTCNYAFLYGKDGYRIFFLGDGQTEYEADFDNIDSCVLWAAYQEFVEKNTEIESKNAMICEKNSGRPVMWFSSRDRLLEYAWMTLTDVNIDEEERTEQDWFIFHVGTDREEIWNWFDDYYSKGVGTLLYYRPEYTTLPWMLLRIL